MSSIMVTDPWSTKDTRRNYRVTRRPMPVCRRRLPLCARSVCWAIFPPGEVEDCLVRPFVKILWTVRGTGLVTLVGRERLLGPRQLAVFFPGSLHQARAGDQPWEVRWWTMDGPLAVGILAGFGLEREDIYEAGPAPGILFERLRRALEDVTLPGETRASALAYRLLAEATARPAPPKTSPRVVEARELLETRWPDSDFDVNALARSLAIHRSSLSRLFSSAHGVSPSQYLVRLRLRHALSLLKQTRLPVQDIARRCGFRDANYFARVFRQTQHQTPVQWRQG